MHPWFNSNRRVVAPFSQILLETSVAIGSCLSTRIFWKQLDSFGVAIYQGVGKADSKL